MKLWLIIFIKFEQYSHEDRSSTLKGTAMEILKRLQIYSVCYQNQNVHSYRR